jgi:iron(III) transport system ATP-binding protein
VTHDVPAIEVPAIEVSDLHVAFGQHVVLAGLDLTVLEGSFTAVLGPSGCGKTTLLRTLAGFERPIGGAISIGGTVVDDRAHHLGPNRRRIGYVPQEGGLFPHLTVAQNVGFGIRERRRRRASVTQLLEMVGLADLKARYPHQLSGGQQQRVALARALAIKPQVVLLDEPFAALDDVLRIALREDVASILRAARTTAILVTHDQDEALSLADHVAVLRGGRVAQYATPADLYEQPADVELANLVGEANLLEGTFDGAHVATPLGTFDVRTNAAAHTPPGRVVVLVRPEDLVAAAAGTPGGVAGVVRSTSFHGHDTLLRVVGSANGVPSTLVARIPGGHNVRVGDAVTLGVRGPVWIFEHSGDAAGLGDSAT